MNVLLLENDVREKDLIVDLLESNDYEVYVCKTPDDVRTFFREKLKEDEGLEPDILIFDIKLDNDQSGIDVASKWYGTCKKRIPLIWLTNLYEDKNVLDRIKKEGLPYEYFFGKTMLKNEDAFINSVHNAIISYTVSTDWVKRSKRRLGFFLSEKKFVFIGKNDFLYAATNGQGDGNCTLVNSKGELLNIGGGRGLSAIARFMEKQFDNLLKLNFQYLINLEKILKIEDDYLYFITETDAHTRSTRIELTEGDLKILRKAGVLFDTVSRRKNKKTG